MANWQQKCKWKIILVKILVKTTGKWYTKYLLSIYTRQKYVFMYVCPHISSETTEPNSTKFCMPQVTMAPWEKIFNGSKHFCKIYVNFLTPHTNECIFTLFSQHSNILAQWNSLHPAADCNYTGNIKFIPQMKIYYLD